MMIPAGTDIILDGQTCTLLQDIEIIDPIPMGDEE